MNRHAKSTESHPPEETHSLEVESESGVVLLNEHSRSSLDGFSPDSSLFIQNPASSITTILMSEVMMASTEEMA